MGRSPCIQRRLIMHRQRLGPLPPGQSVVVLTQNHECGMILQPARLISPPAIKGAVLRMGLLLPATLQHLGQGTCTLISQPEINCRGRGACTRQRFQIPLLKKPLIEQIPGIKEPGVDRKTGRGAVRRTRSIRRRQRQHLPDTNTLICKGADPVPGGLAKPSTDGGGHRTSTPAGDTSTQGPAPARNCTLPAPGPPSRASASPVCSPTPASSASF